MLALTLMLLAATAVAADSPSPWPQQVVQDGNQMAVYQPQLDAWKIGRAHV